MSDVEREVAVTQINGLVEKYGITVKDIPKFNNTHHSDYQTLLGITKSMYDGVALCEGEDWAWEWANNLIDKAWLEELGISCPRKYKIVQVHMTMDLAVPNTWDDSYIEDFALGQDLANNCNFEIVTDDCNITEYDIERFEYCNSTDDFEDEDFYE